MTKKMPTPCPCGSGRTLKCCCGRFLSGLELPSTPEELMRSRYSAFALRRLDWIRATWAPECLPEDLDCGAPFQWFDLKVRNTAMVDATHGTVEFVARAKGKGGRAIRMHALSRFEKRDGKWFYVDDDPAVS